MTKTCKNCEHRDGGMCIRTGFHWTTEIAMGGRCAGPRNGVPEMSLWEPRRTIWMRIKAALADVKIDDEGPI